MGRYSKEFQETVVKKALQNDPREHRSIAEEFNMGYSTLKKWVRRYQEDQGIEEMNKEIKRPQDWTRAERFNALLEGLSLPGDQLGIYCREKGIMSSHLEAWREEFVNGRVEDSQVQNAHRELKKANAELKSLTAELSRKDKALAETAALLILKKKANLLFGEDEDD